MDEQNPSHVQANSETAKSVVAGSVGDSTLADPVFLENNNNNKEETKMADVTEKDIFDLRGDIKDARYDVVRNIDSSKTDLSRQVDAIDDTLTAALHTISRDTQDVRAQLTAVGYQVRDGFVASAKDAEINALKTQVEMAKQTTYLSDKIDAGNQRTTDLINSLRDSDQNRLLIERNTDLVAAVADGRWWRHGFDQANWQGVNNRLNSLDSQFEATRQGMVNFGTMAGVGQTSTSNQVK